eukprot:6213081-Pleurochrysis_carterae.AAC.5
MKKCLQSSFFGLGLRRDRACAVSMHSQPSIPGVDAVCDWSLSLEEAIIGTLAQKLELPEEEDIVGRNEHQIPIVIKPVERTDPRGALRYWFKAAVGFVGLVAEEQIRGSLLPFPAVHFSDIHGRIRRHARHESRALEYGDPEWDFMATLPFPDATWMSSGSSDSRPGVVYSQAHFSVYQRFHPVPLEALDPKSTDTPGSSNTGNRYCVWTVGREYQAFRAARAHTPHER